ACAIGSLLGDTHSFEVGLTQQRRFGPIVAEICASSRSEIVRFFAKARFGQCVCNISQPSRRAWSRRSRRHGPPNTPTQLVFIALPHNRRYCVVLGTQRQAFPAVARRAHRQSPVRGSWSSLR